MAKTEVNPKVALFQQYQVHEDTVNKGKATVLSAIADRSKAVKEIHSMCGKGPFQWQGRTVVIVCRKGKDENDNPIPGQETWFFKEIGKEVQQIG